MIARLDIAKNGVTIPFVLRDKKGAKAARAALPRCFQVGDVRSSFEKGEGEIYE